uniref:Calcineurin binding protein 1 n=1 Tax=Astyanax mexicanus TaxID=7994 RepID=W5K0X9_ASTMX
LPRTEFNMGIWRIPVDEIDRPGSFASHMNRSIVLLLEVLSHLKDHDTLLKISLMLQRTPDQGKKYLRDVDRQVLAKRAFFFTVKVLEDNLDKLTAQSIPETASAPGTDVAPSESSQTQPGQPQPSLLPGNQTQGPVASSQPREGSSGLGEPMELGHSSPWIITAKPREPQTPTDGIPQEQGTIRSAAERAEKVPESGRTPELSLEELSISSKQQQQHLMQVQASTAKGPHAMAVSSTVGQIGSQDLGSLRRPSRKRKLLEDVESGKTLLLDAYRVWQQGQKVMTYDLGRIEKIMSETYMLIKQVDEDVALDQAVKFCQIQMATSTQRQNSSDAPITPKSSKEQRDIFFPASFSSPCLHITPTQLYCQPVTPQDQSQPRTTHCQPIASMAFLPHTGKTSWPEIRICSGVRCSYWCQGMHLGIKSIIPAGKQTVRLSFCISAESVDPLKQGDSSRVRSRIPPNMPKLLIPSTATKFPPEITVTPPTPTLLSPKGSISEETKQKLKNVILASQSAANVKKDTLAQPALEVQETSSQESSLDSESDEEDDYMDI